MIALTCDRPSRLLLGQQNPWEHMLNHAILRSKNPVNTILHIGDQIYPDDEDIQDADKIFNEIYDLASAGQIIDVVILEDCLRSKGVLERIGGLSYLAELARKVPTSAHIKC